LPVGLLEGLRPNFLIHRRLYLRGLTSVPLCCKGDGGPVPRPPLLGLSPDLKNFRADVTPTFLTGVMAVEASDVERVSSLVSALARQQGFGNAGLMVAKVTGGSTAGAMRSIEAGRALMADVGSSASLRGVDATQAASVPMPRYPAVAKAALAGDLSVDAAGLITSGLETIADHVLSDRLHALERRLVDKAVNLAVHEVRRMVARAIARADLRGHEEREQRQHAERCHAWNEDHSGMVTFSGKLDAVTAALIRTAIEQMVAHQFRARRDKDPTERDQRSVGQMRTDALFDLGRTVRLFTRAQRLALLERDGGCPVPRPTRTLRSPPHPLVAEGRRNGPVERSDAVHPMSP
jgi:hypothetical protein